MSIARRRWPAVKQFWFDEPITTRGVDVAYFRQRSNAPVGSTFRTFDTLLVDLTGTEEDIQERFNKETRYEIRRAHTKDALTYMPVSRPDKSLILVFHAFYCLFLKNKGIEDAVDIEYLITAANAGCLHLTSIQWQGEVLVWHSFIASDHRACLLHSASLLPGAESSLKSLISRANRYHHWLDMQYFKGQGVQTYDLGGVYQPKDAQGQPRNNPFKASFGGTRVTEYYGEMACSNLGRFYLWIRSIKKKLSPSLSR